MNLCLFLVDNRDFSVCLEIYVRKLVAMYLFVILNERKGELMTIDLATSYASSYLILKNSA